MLSNIPLHHRLYIVGLPDAQVKAEALRAQRLLASAFEVYQGAMPTLHITLTVVLAVTPADVEKVCGAVKRALVHHPPVEIAVSGYTCIPAPHNSFAMEVKRSQALVQLTERIRRELGADSIQVLNDPSNWTFHITLISDLFSTNPLPQHIYCRLCRRIRRPSAHLRGHVKVVEIWRPDLSNRHVARFLLD